MHFPVSLNVASPVLSPDVLRTLATDALRWTQADTMSVRIDHTAIGATRIARNTARRNDSGDMLTVELSTQFGQRVGAGLDVNQVDADTLRAMVEYLDRIAREQRGDPRSLAMPIAPRRYLPNTTWHLDTVTAFQSSRHDIVPTLVEPFLTEKIQVAAFVGVFAHSTVYADKQGLLAAGQETDAELTVAGWNLDRAGRMSGMGWAGQAARDWATIDPMTVAAEGLRMTRLAANPVAFEPGRHMTILGPAAVAQFVRPMGGAFDAASTLHGLTPLYDRAMSRSKLGEQVIDPRLTMSSDPNDLDGGYLPFNRQGFPLLPMTWIERGVLTHLAYDTYFAAEQGVTPANDAPESLRMTGGSTTIEEMIVNCRAGIYVNRVTDVEGVGDFDPTSSLLTGVTHGGCFLIRNGKIDRAIRNLRFVESPWFALNRIEAIGPSIRAPFGYAPWQGEWPIAPAVVPPLMIRDFNFTALADTA